MTSRISHTTVDSRNAYTQLVWWAQVLDMSEDPADPILGHEECLVFSPGGRQRVQFIEVPEAKEIKNRIHFDLRPLDLSCEDEIDRVLALGATEFADHRRPDGGGWGTSPIRRAMSSAYCVSISRCPTTTHTS